MITVMLPCVTTGCGHVWRYSWEQWYALYSRGEVCCIFSNITLLHCNARQVSYFVTHFTTSSLLVNWHVHNVMLLDNEQTCIHHEQCQNMVTHSWQPTLLLRHACISTFTIGKFLQNWESQSQTVTWHSSLPLLPEVLPVLHIKKLVPPSKLILSFVFFIYNKFFIINQWSGFVSISAK